MVTTERVITLFSSPGCHLCEQALALLYRFNSSLVIEQVDVVEDETLMARYGERIPVLRCDDRELDWPFSLLDLAAFLSQ